MSGKTHIKMFGIKNCDTIKKAQSWLSQRKIAFSFVDFREEPLSAPQVKRWLAMNPPAKMINKRSTTWKQLPDATRQELETLLNKTELLGDLTQKQTQMLANLLAEQPTLIKRPLLTYEQSKKPQIEIGFAPAQYETLF